VPAEGLAAIDVEWLEAGGRMTCGVTRGELYCLGENGDRQLGNGTTVDSLVPVRVELERAGP
jgi:hypothetical protein